MQIKPGVIAVIIRAKTTTENLGRAVKVLSADSRNPGWWLVQATSGKLRAASIMSGGGAQVESAVIYAHHTHLMPLAGEPDPWAIADAMLKELRA